MKLKALLMAMCAVTLVGCGEGEVKTIEYYSLPENKAETEKVLADCEVAKKTGKNCENAELGRQKALFNEAFSSTIERTSRDK